MPKQLERYAPALFVFLWSTGFIGAKYIVPYAEPFTFLTIRYFFAAVILFVIAAALKQPLKLTKDQFKASFAVGMLLHVIYIGGVFYAVSLGVSAGISAVIVSIQPVLVSLLAVPLLGERLRWVQVVGLFLGVAGIALLLLPKVFQGDYTATTSLTGIFICVIALLGTSGGYLVQKKLGGEIPFLSGTGAQYAVSAIAFAILSFSTEDQIIQWVPQFFFGLTWIVLMLSIASIVLLYGMLRTGSASKVSSLYYLVPPTAAVQAYFLFDEVIAPIGIIGMALAGLGVVLVMRQSTKVK
ncbi:MAG: DMT family transporter [Actinobacteria bacterium]|nr:DMT family transporter [Actinomycetota bacterium]NBO35484.1 DMT family transporter [Actinomycetota bacterium]